MSSTNNIQNYLSNVFRPVATYASSLSSPFQVKLNMSNISTITADTVQTGSINVGDNFGNVYLGTDSGNPPDIPQNSSNNVALGALAGRLNSNVANSIFIGYAAGTNVSNASNTIALGSQTIVGGSGNVYIGTGTGALIGSNNIFLGNDILASNVNDRLYIGRDASNIVISADLSDNQVGILTTDPQYPIHLDNYTYIYNGLGINANPQEHTLNVNGDFFVEDGFGYFTFDHDETTSNTIVEIASYTPGKTAIVNICGDLYVKGSLNLSGTIFQTNIGGDTVFVNTLLDVSNADAQISNLYASNATISNTFTVDATSTFNGSTTFNGIVDFSNTTTIDGSAIFNSTLEGNAPVTFNDIVTFNSNIFVNDTSYFTDICANSITTSGDIVCGGTVFGTIAGTITTTNVTVPGFIEASGNITTSNTLYVYNSALGNNAAQIYQDASGSAVVSGGIYGDTGNSGQLVVASFSSPNKRIALGYNQNNDVGVIQSVESGVGTKSLTLNPASGNVGVGRIDPFYSLDVSGFVRATGGVQAETVFYSVNAAYMAGITRFDQPVLTGAGQRTHFGLANISGASVYELWKFNTIDGPLGTLTSGDFAIQRFDTAGGNQGYPIYVKRSDGSVGIGNINPSYTLDVNGSTRALSNVFVRNSGATSTTSRVVLGPNASSTDLDYCSMIQSTQNPVTNFGSELSLWTHGGSSNNSDPTRAITIDSNQATTFASNVTINGTLNGKFASGLAALVRIVEDVTPGVRTITVPSTSGNYIAYVTLIGGGGGGGGGGAISSGGGGGGGSVVTFETPVSAGQVISITVGSGGTGGAGSSGSTGTNGGNGTATTLGMMSAAGGLGGGGASSGTGGSGGSGYFGGGGGRATTTGGTAGTGTIANGFAGTTTGAGYGGSVTGPIGIDTGRHGGYGGGEAQYAGVGGLLNQNGSAGSRYGAGGGGGSRLNFAVGNGGNGASGAVIIRFFPI